MTFLAPTYNFVTAAKKLNFFDEKKGSNFCQKYEVQIFVKNVKFFFRFFHRSSAKLRRTAKRPTVLSSLL